MEKTDKHKRGHFIQVPRMLLSTLTSLELHVYAVMDSFAIHDRKCSASMQTIANTTGLHFNTVRKAILQLEKKGYIACVDSYRVPTKGGLQSVKVYQIVDIWEQNTDFFNKGLHRTRLSPDQKGLQNFTPLSSKGVQDFIPLSPKGVQNFTTSNSNYSNSNNLSERALRDSDGLSVSVNTASAIQGKESQQQAGVSDGRTTTESDDYLSWLVDDLIEILKKVRNIESLDGKHNFQHSIEIYKKLQSELKKIGQPTTHSRVLEAFEVIIEKVFATSSFHYANATSMRYINMNFQKILIAYDRS